MCIEDEPSDFNKGSPRVRERSSHIKISKVDLGRWKS